jgi:hypothetical protein
VVLDVHRPRISNVAETARCIAGGAMLLLAGGFLVRGAVLTVDWAAGAPFGFHCGPQVSAMRLVRSRCSSLFC